MTTNRSLSIEIRSHPMHPFGSLSLHGFSVTEGLSIFQASRNGDVGSLRAAPPELLRRALDGAGEVLLCMARESGCPAAVAYLVGLRPELAEEKQ